jgi:ATP-binding cassette subfamily B multidrug efflux pump
MLSRFERFLTPTAAPEHPEPPPSLLAFLWHFARQAKWLFVALFVVELLVALSDSAVPWFIGRVVTLVTKTPPERLVADGWPWFLGMAAVVLVVRPTVTFTRYLITNQAIAAPFTGLIRWQSHWHVVRQSWAFFQDDFAGRISNRVMQTGPSVRSTLTATITTVWYIDRRGRPLARGTDPALVLRLCRAARAFRAAHARPLQTVFGGTLDADGTYRRQLHQHSDR